MILKHHVNFHQPQLYSREISGIAGARGGHGRVISMPKALALSAAREQKRNLQNHNSSRLARPLDFPS